MLNIIFEEGIGFLSGNRTGLLNSILSNMENLNPFLMYLNSPSCTNPYAMTCTMDLGGVRLISTKTSGGGNGDDKNIGEESPFVVDVDVTATGDGDELGGFRRMGICDECICC